MLGSPIQVERITCMNQYFCEIHIHMCIYMYIERDKHAKLRTVLTAGKLKSGQGTGANRTAAAGFPKVSM